MNKVDNEHNVYKVDIKYCNNIEKGSIQIEPNKLNIKYGINGTGKTTLARAIQYSKDNNMLQTLKSYFAKEDANVLVEPSLNNILVFDEQFVNQVVFKEDEVIENTFEIFLKTPNYDEKKAKIDQHLQSLRDMLKTDFKTKSLKDNLIKIDEKFKRTKKGDLSTTGAMKSLLSKQNIYNIPSELEDFKLFFENNDINIPWIDWKNKGDEYDIGDNCPYCSAKLDTSKHKKQKDIFSKTYSKNDSKNLKEVLELLDSLKMYLKPDKYDELVLYVKNDTPSDIIKAIIKKLKTEFELIITRFDAIDGFGQKKIASIDISGLEKEIANMEFPTELFEIFGGDITNSIFANVNGKVKALKKEVANIKKEMGALKGIVQATIKASQSDINEFLKTAGINYELVIEAEDEANSKTILKECFNDEKTEVKNIRQHLSWGEKNAFSLVLFMYYAQSQHPDLIILDDPISSFDINKKYAILHRIFKNIGKRDISLVGSTVLLLTHDFEPITDFIVVGKLAKEQAVASFVCNENRIVSEVKIDPQKDVKLIFCECEEIAKNTDINIVSRIAFLRKLCELNGCRGVWDSVYQILSCLIHAKDIERKVCNDRFIEMDKKEILAGTNKIKEYILDFNYNDLKTNVYKSDWIKGLYEKEKNSYIKIQLFRALCEVSNEISIKPNDEGWYKFIDETYHIENDYLHYLDITKFNIVPSYILEKVDNMMSKMSEKSDTSKDTKKQSMPKRKKLVPKVV